VVRCGSRRISRLLGSCGGGGTGILASTFCWPVFENGFGHFGTVQAGLGRGGRGGTADALIIRVIGRLLLLLPGPEGVFILFPQDKFRVNVIVLFDGITVLPQSCQVVTLLFVVVAALVLVIVLVVVMAGQGRSFCLSEHEKRRQRWLRLR